jgi:hypothetical protein
VAISLSRKKEDKVSGTGRFHIMKNRYGGDGMTFGAKIDTSTGRFEIFNDYDSAQMFLLHISDEIPDGGANLTIEPISTAQEWAQNNCIVLSALV